MILTDHPWPYVLLCLLAGVAYAAVLYFVGRQPVDRGWRWALAALRCVAVSAIAFLLLAPTSRQTVNERQKPHVVLAQDVSRSVRSSADSAFSLQALVPELKERFRVSYVPFGTEGSTDIGAVIDRYRGDAVDALVLASDGLHNRGTSPASVAEGLAFPVYCVALGDTTPRRDALLADLRCNRIALSGSRFTAEVTVAARLLKGHSAQLTVRDARGRQLAKQQVDYGDDDFSSTCSLDLPAEGSGMQRYDVVLGTVEGEHSTENNRLAFYVDVIDSRRHVAIIANAPHPDLGAWKHAIESNSNFEAEVVMAEQAESGRWKAEGTDLVVLHNLPSASHTSLRYAEGLPQIFVVGLQTDLNRFNALHSGLEIVAKARRQNEVTALWQSDFSLFTLDAGDGAVLEALPPLSALFGESKRGAGVQTLLTARVGQIDSRQPLVAAATMNGQRRAWIWGEGLWRWRLVDYQNNKSHEHVDRLVSQIVTFTAMQSSRERLQVEAQRSYAEGEPVVLRAVLYNENYEPVNNADVALELRGDSLQSEYDFRRAADGYALTLPALKEGMYRYRATAADGLSAEGSFVVEAVNLEQRRTTADHALLATVASLTGGKMVTPENLSAVKESLNELKPTIYSHIRYAEFLRLPLVLVLIVLLLVCEWALRKYNNTI